MLKAERFQANLLVKYFGVMQLFWNTLHCVDLGTLIEINHFKLSTLDFQPTKMLPALVTTEPGWHAGIVS